MKHSLFSGTFAFAALAFAQPAQADLVNARDANVIADVMKAKGLPAEVNSHQDSGPSIASEYGELRFVVIFNDCDDAFENCKTIQFFTGFTDAKDTTLAKINEWNRDRRFTRSYRDDEGDPVMEMDLDLDFDGIPRVNVDEAIGIWLSAMDAFYDHIYSDQEPDRPSSDGTV